MIATGIDILRENPARILPDRNLALITGASVIDSTGKPVYQVVKELFGPRLKAIWSLQHGFFVDKQDNMILSPSFYWTELGLEIKSLYGEHLLPPDDWLTGIGALVVDVFDVGTRVYTFVNHLVLVMKHLSGKDIPVIVLDRPNPLNGRHLEGNLLEDDYSSIVGQLPVPMRHGLTAGEYLSYALTYHHIDLELHIVQARGWQRRDAFTGTWTLPSPNMPTCKTALVYPGAVMLEGTNLSEGRGTTRPFEFVGSPHIDHFRLVEELRSLSLPGVNFIPVFFKPEFSKYAGQVCKGILVTPTDARVFSSFAVYYEIIRLSRQLDPAHFQFKEPPYEFEFERPPIDMICGSPLIRRAIEQNLPFLDIRPQIDQDLDQYRQAIAPFLLYRY